MKKRINGIIYEKINSKKEFNKWLKRNMFDNYDDFLNSTGVFYEEIKGKWFNFEGGRIFTIL